MNSHRYVCLFISISWVDLNVSILDKLIKCSVFPNIYTYCFMLVEFSLLLFFGLDVLTSWLNSTATYIYPMAIAFLFWSIIPLISTFSIQSSFLINIQSLPVCNSLPQPDQVPSALLFPSLSFPFSHKKSSSWDIEWEYSMGSCCCSKKTLPKIHNRPSNSSTFILEEQSLSPLTIDKHIFPFLNRFFSIDLNLQYLSNC